MKHSTKTPGLTGAGGAHRGMRSTLAIIATAALALLFTTIGSAPQSAEAAPYAHCDSLYNTPGLGMDCTVEVVNNLDLATGVTSSTTTYTRCSGAANTALTCEGPTTVSSTELVTSVSQCNSSLDGGGASMHCSVRITNNIVGDATAVGATVNQCNDSLVGGGERVCDPDPATTSGAAINQCNNSANGGGSSLTCTVVAGSTTTDALPVTVSQCNYSANGGGSLIVCSVQLTTNATPAVVVPPPDEEEETPPTGEEEVVTPPPDSEVLGDQVVAGPFGPERLAVTGSIPASPLTAILLAVVGALLAGWTRIARPRNAFTG